MALVLNRLRLLHNIDQGNEHRPDLDIVEDHPTDELKLDRAMELVLVQ